MVFDKKAYGRVYMRGWRQRNLEKSRASSRNHYARHKDEINAKSKTKRTPESTKAMNLKSKYGLTTEEFKAMYDKQKGKCAICGKPFVISLIPTAEGRPPTVDHNHSTNRIRGLLCSDCNTLLGYAHDDPRILKLAIEYLQAIAE
jgi:hypothetical protein